MKLFLTFDDCAADCNGEHKVVCYGDYEDLLSLLKIVQKHAFCSNVGFAEDKKECKKEYHSEEVNSDLPF